MICRNFPVVFFASFLLLFVSTILYKIFFLLKYLFKVLCWGQDTPPSNSTSSTENPRNCTRHPGGPRDPEDHRGPWHKRPEGHGHGPRDRFRSEEFSGGFRR